MAVDDDINKWGSSSYRFTRSMENGRAKAERDGRLSRGTKLSCRHKRRPGKMRLFSYSVGHTKKVGLAAGSVGALSICLT